MNEEDLAISYLEPLKIEQPENPERVQDNPKQRKVQGNLGVSGLWHLRNPPHGFPQNSRDIQQRTRVDFARKQWVTNWGWRRPRNRPLRGEGRGLVTEKMELRSPRGAEAGVEADAAGPGREIVAPRRAAVVGEGVHGAAARQTFRASRRSCGVCHAS